MLGPPDQGLAHATRRGVYQQGFARAHRVDLSKQHAGGEALDGQAGGGLVGHVVRETEREGRGQQAPLRIRAVGAVDVGDPIADREPAHAGSHLLDDG
jgi:hypothetical protein